MPSGRFSAREPFATPHECCTTARVARVHVFGTLDSTVRSRRGRVDASSGAFAVLGCGEGVDAYHSYCTALRLNFAKKREVRGEVIAHRSPAQRVIVRMAPRQTLRRARQLAPPSGSLPPPRRQAAAPTAPSPPGDSATGGYLKEAELPCYAKPAFAELVCLLR